MDTRYERILEPTDTWAIFDRLEGVPVMVGTRLMIGLTEKESEEVLAMLNAPPKRRKDAAA